MFYGLKCVSCFPHKFISNLVPIPGTSGCNHLIKKRPVWADAELPFGGGGGLGGVWGGGGGQGRQFWPSMTVVCVSGGGDSRSVPVPSDTCGKRQQGGLVSTCKPREGLRRNQACQRLHLGLSKLQINFCCLSHPDPVIFMAALAN